MLALLASMALLAACGQTTTTSATNGADAGLKALKTPTLTSATPTATTIPLPYTFPKQWLAAPDGGDLPAAIGSLAFAPSAPQTGYVCGVSSTSADNAATTPPYVVATSDGGQSWHTVAGSAAHAKSACALFVDQNNGRDVFAEAGDFSRGQQQLYRSQDGGATWKTIPKPSISDMNTSVIAVAVVQSRLLAMIAVNGEGAPPHSFFASDNGGQSWKPVDLMVNGQALQISEQLWFDGPALVVEAAPPCTEGCGYALPVGSGRMGKRPLNQPLSSQPPTPNYYFKSTDGGRTWTSFATPVSNLGNLAFARSSDGATTYALGTAPIEPGKYIMNNIGYFSRDGGASWKQLPTFAGVEQGYPDPGSFAIFGAYVLPDGSVISTSFHTNEAVTGNGSEAGVFLLRLGDPNPAWQPLINSLNALALQPVPTSAGVRVWGLDISSGQSGGQLVYFDLP